jgi:hypothetical protein
MTLSFIFTLPNYDASRGVNRSRSKARNFQELRTAAAKRRCLNLPNRLHHDRHFIDRRTIVISKSLRVKIAFGSLIQRYGSGPLTRRICSHLKVGLPTIPPQRRPAPFVKGFGCSWASESVRRTNLCCCGLRLWGFRLKAWFVRCLWNEECQRAWRPLGISWHVNTAGHGVLAPNLTGFGCGLAPVVRF